MDKLIMPVQKYCFQINKSSKSLFILFFFFFFFFFQGYTCGIWKFSGQGSNRNYSCHSHSSRGSKPYLQPRSQLMATPDSQPIERGQGLNPHPHGYQLDSFLLHHNGNSNILTLKNFLDSIRLCEMHEILIWSEGRFVVRQMICFICHRMGWTLVYCFPFAKVDSLVPQH